MVNLELSDDAIADQVVRFETYYRKLYASPSRPFMEAIFDEWVEEKDFAPGDRVAIRAAVFKRAEKVS